MRRNILILGSLLAALAVPAIARTSRAAGNGKLKQVATMAIPGKKINIFDISWVDQKTQRYFLSDRTNSSVDVFNARTDKYIGSIAGFVGVKMKNGKPNYGASGPDGVLVEGDVAWAGDGDSTVKEIDLKTMKIVATIPTGGTHRCDELAYDPTNHVLACGNGDENPPFLSLISTTERKVIAKIPFANATDGIEAPAYNPADGLFYLSIPELDHNPKKNGVAVITPKGKLLKILPVENCHPAGIVFGPGQNFLLGCTANGEKGMPPIAVVMNAKTGKLVATIPGVGGTDEVAYSAKNHQYYSAGGDAHPSALFVIDALTNKLVQTIPTGGNAHSVAASDVTGKVFAPEGAAGCGCIRVFAPTK
ncbi:MAG TPA: cytochrome C nitrite reductase [Candidatus Dormibacteraeota bacterium]|nr:cytochrome C nitrite reductase [Candidatus Dormibacteraeota bacterium]